MQKFANDGPREISSALQRVHSIDDDLVDVTIAFEDSLCLAHTIYFPKF